MRLINILLVSWQVLSSRSRSPPHPLLKEGVASILGTRNATFDRCAAVPCRHKLVMRSTVDDAKMRGRGCRCTVSRWEDHGTDPLNVDTDGDGVGSDHEIPDSTNPLDPNDF